MKKLNILKKYLCAAMAVVMLVGLTACGGNSQSKEEVEEPAAGEETAETPAEEPAPAVEPPAPEEPEPAEEPAAPRPKRVLFPGRFATPEPEVQEEPEEGRMLLIPIE